MLAKSPDVANAEAFAAERQTLEQLLEPADIHINSIDPRPWDITVHDAELFARVLRGGMPAFCNAYIDGWWDCDALDQLFTKLAAHLSPDQFPWKHWRMYWPEMKLHLLSRIVNMQNSKRAFMVGSHHYDRGNDLFERMLDPTMAYSCGYFGSGAQTLEEAQIAKLDLICRKLDLKPGMRVLDVGCGWGGLMAHMVKHYGVRATGITVSQEQKNLAMTRYANLYATGNYRIELIDYRDLPNRFSRTFERIVSVGMFEHVGPKNYRDYFKVAAECLTDNGLMLLHSIGGSGRPNAWIHEAVFPNGVLPSEVQITNAIHGILTLRDWHDFGQDYDPTLMAWNKNCRDAQHELSARNPAYGHRFWRFWYLYLQMCAGGFRSGRTHLWQLVLSKPGQQVNYRSVR